MMPFTEEHEGSCTGSDDGSDDGSDGSDDGSDDGSHYLTVSGVNQEQAPKAQGKDILANTGAFLTYSPSSW